VSWAFRIGPESMLRSSRSRRKGFWGWVVGTPSSGSSPRPPNRNADAAVRGAGGRPRDRTAVRGTKKAIVNVVTGNQVGAVGLPVGTVAGNGRVEIEARVVVMVGCDLDRPQEVVSR
jgi:hypothetical protein